MKNINILRWRQHKQDEDGWLIAEDQDLVDAKELMMTHKLAHHSDLVESEIKVVGTLMDGNAKTQKELTIILGIAQSTLSARLKSILAKSSVITEDLFEGKKLYQLNPKMDTSAAFWQNLDLVDLKIVNKDGTYRTLSYCYRSVIGMLSGIDINNSRLNLEDLSVNREKCVETCQNCNENSSCFFSLHKTAERPITSQNESPVTENDTDNRPLKDPITTKMTNSEAPERPIRQSGDVISTIKDTPINNEATFSKIERPTPIIFQFIVRFLKSCSAFVGIDGRTYGTYKAGDITSAIPRNLARNIVSKGYAVYVNIEDHFKTPVDSILYRCNPCDNIFSLDATDKTKVCPKCGGSDLTLWSDVLKSLEGDKPKSMKLRFLHPHDAFIEDIQNFKRV